MKRLLLIAITLLAPAGALFLPVGAWGQGVNDPSTPNRNVVIVNPSQPSPSTATRNIPSRIQAPLTRGGRAIPYYGNRTRGSASSRR